MQPQGADLKALSQSETITKLPEYRQWLQKAKGWAALLKLLEKICNMGDQGDEDDGSDEEFEDAEVDDDENGVATEGNKEIDLNESRKFIWNLIAT